MSADLQPRAPTLVETAQIIDAIARQGDLTRGEALVFVNAARIAVFDDYMPDGPGYCGRVAIVLYSGGADCVETYVFRDELATRQPTAREQA